MFKYENIYVAGISTLEEFQTWLRSNKPDTGYYFKRLVDGLNMGTYICLGMDYSLVNYGLTKIPREDKIEYYEEVKEEEIQE